MSEVYPVESNRFFDYPGPGVRNVMRYNEVLVWVALFHFSESFIAKEIRDFVNKNQECKLSSRMVDRVLIVFRQMGYVEATFSTRGAVIQYKTSLMFRALRRKNK